MPDPAHERHVSKSALGDLLLQIVQLGSGTDDQKMHLRQPVTAILRGIEDQLQTMRHADGADIGDNRLALKSETRAKLGGRGAGRQLSGVNSVGDDNDLVSY